VHWWLLVSLSEDVCTILIESNCGQIALIIATLNIWGPLFGPPPSPFSFYDVAEVVIIHKPI